MGIWLEKHIANKYIQYDSWVMLGMFEYRVPHVWTNQFVLVKIITAWVNLGAAEDPLDIDDLYNM